MSKRERKGEAIKSRSRAWAKLDAGNSETKETPGISGFQEDLIRLKFERDVLHIFIEHARLNNGPHLKQFLDNMERTILCRLLERFNGCQKTTARYLGIKYTTLHEKVKKHHIYFFKQPVGLSEDPRPTAGSLGL
jgi:DNA-binding NtrC family response regulator